MTLEDYAAYLRSMVKKHPDTSYVKPRGNATKKMIRKQFSKTKKTKYAKRRF